MSTGAKKLTKKETDDQTINYQTERQTDRIYEKEISFKDCKSKRSVQN